MAAQQAAGMAGQGGKPNALSAANSLGKLPPPGKLDLGPKGLRGGAAGIGGGAGVRGPAMPAGAPSSAAGIANGRVVAAAARAGLGSAVGGAAAGAPGAGAPAAGHQGAAQGAGYQPSKALRRKKNGEELIGDTEAVVAVLGEPTRPEDAKPEGT